MSGVSALDIKNPNLSPGLATSIINSQYRGSGADVVFPYM
jgi:hypothetical protein